MEDKKSLEDALKAAGIVILPKARTERSNPYWLKAVCKVYKANGAYAYCLCENRGDGTPQIKRDFGPMSVILRIESVHPYHELEKRFIPKLRSDREIERYLFKSDIDPKLTQSLLAREGKDGKAIASDRRKIKELIMGVAIKDARLMLEEEARCRKITEYGEGTGKENQ